eukprot:1158893-Pelagomonas_calceolata.AAC.24
MALMLQSKDLNGVGLDLGTRNLRGGGCDDVNQGMVMQLFQQSRGPDDMLLALASSTCKAGGAVVSEWIKREYLSKSRERLWRLDTRHAWERLGLSRNV